MASSPESGRREGRARTPTGVPAVGHGEGPGSERPPRLVQLGAFLRSHRERLAPETVGLPARRHRTPGIRREDVADLARISAAWYERIEQGQDVHPSLAALHAIAEALRLDAAERTYVFRLAGALDPGGARARGGVPPGLRAVDAVPSPEAPDGTPPALRRLLESVLAPALLIDRYWDVVGRNAALEAFVPRLAPVRTRPDRPPQNVVRHVLMTKDVGDGARGWEVLARACVSGLRTTLAEIWAEPPEDPHAAALVAALTRESPEFRAWWPEHRVWAADSPLRHVVDHPRVGPVAVEVTLLDVRSAPGLTLVTCVPGDGASAAKLQHLAASAAHPQPGA